MKVEEVISRVADSMDAKFERRFKSFCNSLDALAEARQREPFRFVCFEWDRC